jgi:hypothetical protein
VRVILLSHTQKLCRRVTDHYLTPSMDQIRSPDNRAGLELPRDHGSRLPCLTCAAAYAALHSCATNTRPRQVRQYQACTAPTSCSGAPEIPCTPLLRIFISDTLRDTGAAADSFSGISCAFVHLASALVVRRVLIVLRGAARLDRPSSTLYRFELYHQPFHAQHILTSHNSPASLDTEGGCGRHQFKNPTQDAAALVVWMS